MAKKQINLIQTRTRDNAIVQGSSFSYTFAYLGDASSATARGQIRSGIPQDGGELLAEFSFSTPFVFDSVTGVTEITANLSPAVTKEIPYTKFQGEGEATAENCYLYDIELELANGVVEKLVPLSLVQVKPEITVDY